MLNTVESDSQCVKKQESLTPQCVEHRGVDLCAVCGTAGRDTSSYGMADCNTACHVTTCCGTTCHGTTWHDSSGYGTAGRGTAGCGWYC